jgi:hypothetical protein
MYRTVVLSLFRMWKQRIGCSYNRGVCQSEIPAHNRLIFAFWLFSTQMVPGKNLCLIKYPYGFCQSGDERERLTFVVCKCQNRKSV